MFVIYKAYDDNTSVVLDIGTFGMKEMTEQDLIRFINNGNNVLGASVSGQKLNYLNAYECLSFPTESEADEYIRYNGLSYKNKRYACNYFWVFNKINHKTHVDYYVCSWAGDVATYVANNGGYTQYLNGAKVFDKRSAGEQAAIMTRKSRTGKHWTIQRVVKEYNYE